MWAEARGLSILPAHPWTVSNYVAHLASVSGAPHSAALAGTAIAFYHTSNGFASPSLDSQVKRCLTGIKKTLAKPTVRKAPLTVDLFHRLLPALLGPSVDGWITPFERARLADWRTAVLDVLTYTSIARFGDFLDVSRGQVHFEDGMLVIHFGLSKMNQFRTNDRIDRYMATNGIYCPVRLVKQYLALLRPDPSLPLFPSFPSGVEAPKPVSYHGARIAFKKALDLIGADPSDYGMHSGRTGGNLATMEAGLPLDVRGRKGRYADGSTMPNYYARSALRLEEVRLTSAALSLEPK